MAFKIMKTSKFYQNENFDSHQKSLISETRRKKGIAMETLTWWLIAIAVLAVILLFAYLLRDRLAVFAEYIKNLFR